MSDSSIPPRLLVVTGVVGGSSTVVETRRVVATPGAVELWRVGSDDLGEVPGPGTSTAFYPAARGGAFWRLLTLPPEPDASNVDPEVASEAFFRILGIPECRVDTRRHPTMHATPTVDFAILLSGELILLVDEGEPVRLRAHDMVVQRATNHAWVNPGPAPAVLLVALFGALAGS